MPSMPSLLSSSHPPCKRRFALLLFPVEERKALKTPNDLLKVTQVVAGQDQTLGSVSVEKR